MKSDEKESWPHIYTSMKYRLYVRSPLSPISILHRQRLRHNTQDNTSPPQMSFDANFLDNGERETAKA